MSKCGPKDGEPHYDEKNRLVRTPCAPMAVDFVKSHPITLPHYPVVIVSLLVVLTAGLFEVRRICVNNNALLASLRTPATRGESRPVVWVYSKSSDQSHLHHVTESFRRYGYRLGGRTDPWSVLWSHEYPFTELPNEMHELRSGQVVNHFPGSGYITNKGSLSTDRSIRQLPLTFKLPDQKEEFLQNVAEQPSAMWVQKNRDHRGIRVVEPSAVSAASGGETFVQELIANPLLVDGKKFDIGVYVVMTSLEPLRVYVYRGDVLLRFCASPYNVRQFNASDVDSYVVGDDYTPIWDVPSLARYYVRTQLGMRASLDAYLREQLGVDSGTTWAELERIVASVYERKAEAMRRAASRWPRAGRFFELVRFDFVLDEALGVHLLEANMSPNLSSAHFAANGPFYEQLLFSLLSLVGLGAPATQSEASGAWRFVDRAASALPFDCPVQQGEEEEQQQRCEQPVSLCLPRCLPAAHKQIFRDAFWEHLNKKQFARLVPRTDGSDPEGNLTTADRVMAQWFRAMCTQDPGWC